MRGNVEGMDRSDTSTGSKVPWKPLVEDAEIDVVGDWLLS